jgi:hypothetical protein
MFFSFAMSLSLRPYFNFTQLHQLLSFDAIALHCLLWHQLLSPLATPRQSESFPSHQLLSFVDHARQRFVVHQLLSLLATPLHSALSHQLLSFDAIALQSFVVHQLLSPDAIPLQSAPDRPAIYPEFQDAAYSITATIEKRRNAMPMKNFLFIRSSLNKK